MLKMFFMGLITIVVAINIFREFGFWIGIFSLIPLALINGYLTKFFDTETYQQAMDNQKQPDESDEYFNRGNSCAGRGLYDKAIEHYTKSVDINPRYDAYYNRGLAYAFKGFYDNAIVDFTTAVTLNPKLDESYSSRGFVYIEKHSYNLALADFNTVIAINPKYHRAYLGKAIAYENLGLKTEAVKTYREYLQCAPDNDDNVYEAKERLAELGG